MTAGERNAWVSLLDSGAWRRISGSAAGRRVLRSPGFRALDMTRRRTMTSLRVRRDPDRFASVHAFCMFLGHVKSGGSLLGALLDAHPDALVSDEIDVVSYVRSGFRRDQIFHLVERGSRREAQKGRVTARRLDPYSLAVPGQFQGRARTVRVIGDVRSGPTTRTVGDDPELLSRVEATLAPVPIRFIHVVRSPFDPVSAMVRRGGRSLDNAIGDYAAQCRRLDRLRAEIPEDRLITVHYDQLMTDPTSELRRVCSFLDLSTDEAYLRSCASIIDPTRPGERQSVQWDDQAVASVGELIDRTPFLAPYAAP